MIFPDQAVRIVIATKPPLAHASMRCRAAGGLLFARIERTTGRIVVVASLGYKLGLRSIRFDDKNWDTGYGANPAYSQSKLAQMMFGYEPQDRAKAAGGNVAVHVCHSRSSASSLIRTSGGLLIRMIWWLMTKTPLVQTAEKGAYPEVMCATETELEQRAFYGPTGRMEMVTTCQPDKLTRRPTMAA